MEHLRVIPALLLSDGGLVKTIRFKNPTYIGDPINAVHIFNDKEADELGILDISVSRNNTEPNYKMLKRIGSEAFMPLSYGGGLKTADSVKRILGLGFEKVILDSAALNNPALIDEVAGICGSQSLVCCIDVKKTWAGSYAVYSYSKKRSLQLDPVAWAKQLQDRGAGEILVYSVDRDGTFEGYDLNILKKISSEMKIPVIALGGAARLDHFHDAVVHGGVDAVAAGSMFVFQPPRRAVLISYPNRSQIKQLKEEIGKSLDRGIEGS